MNWIATALVICAPLAATAGDATAPQSPATPAPNAAEAARKGTAYAGAQLYCRDAEGNRREIGTVICVSASCQTWMARCEQSLNNSTWRKMSDGCPAVSLAPDLLRRLQSLEPGRHAGAVDPQISAAKT